MREARLRLGLPQDKLGVKIGLDEHTASARMSRYENGVHHVPLAIARKIAKTLKVPLAYLYCDDDKLAEIIVAANALSHKDQDNVLHHIRTTFSPSSK
jgi:transcriptional regulator with XRE-family HTH domain